MMSSRLADDCVLGGAPPGHIPDEFIQVGAQWRTGIERNVLLLLVVVEVDRDNWRRVGEVTAGKPVGVQLDQGPGRQRRTKKPTTIWLS
jgi:hypothetical protein